MTSAKQRTVGLKDKKVPALDSRGGLGQLDVAVVSPKLALLLLCKRKVLLQLGIGKGLILWLFLV